MDSFYRTLGGLIDRPWLALLPGALLLALYIKARKPSVLIAGLAWVVYCLYESGMKLRILCGGECNIRIDLMLIYPVLVAVSLGAMVRAVLVLRAKHPSP